ncbi:MAG: SbcC/MukB-like Walker B domain-containing protein, partial [Limisphaerales bacterium]
QAELDENIAKLNTIDRARFDEVAQREQALETKLKRVEEERRQLDRSEMRARVRSLEQKLGADRLQQEKLQDHFKSVRDEADVSGWLKRMQELRCEMLARFPSKEIAADKFANQYHDLRTAAAAAWEELKAKRRELAIAHSKFDDLAIESEENDAYAKQLSKLEESEIPEYKTKAERERKNWESLFRTQILEKLHTALSEVKNLLFILNQELRKRPIGNNRYQISHWQNPDYKIYHELLEASSLARADELFFSSAEPRFQDAIQHFLKTLTEHSDSQEAERLLDYRHYFEYDMEVFEEDGRKTSVDKHSGKFSGGENQSPYFIAILASYLRAYRRYSSRKQEPSIGLVPIDEAFSKLSGERIKDCITAMKAFDLQGVFSMSTGNIPYAFEHCDWLVVVSKEERRNGKRTEIRNVPVSLARDSDDARRLMGKEQ